MCKPEDDNKKMTEGKDKIEQLIDTAKPVLAKVGFGAVMGYTSGKLRFICFYVCGDFTSTFL